MNVSDYDVINYNVLSAIGCQQVVKAYKLICCKTDNLYSKMNNFGKFNCKIDKKIKLNNQL